MAYKKPASICMDLLLSNLTCNDDPVLRFIPKVAPPPDWGVDTPIFAQADSQQPGVNKDFGQDADIAKITKDRMVVANDRYDVDFASEGAIHIFFYNGSTWELEQTINPPVRGTSKFYGTYVAMNGDGTRCVTAQDSAGATAQANVFVYERTGTTWSLLTTITTTYNVGSTSGAVVMSSDGNVVLTMNNSTAGELEIWRYNGASYDQDTKYDIGNSNFPRGMNISENGRYIVAPEYSQSRFYVFEDTSGNGDWVQRGPTSGIPSTSVSAKAATITNDGNGVAVASSTFLNTFYWNGSTYDAIDQNLATGGSVTGGGMSSDGTYAIAQLSTTSNIAVFQGDISTGFTLADTLVPDDPSNGGTNSVISYDGRMVSAASTSWKTANGQQGRVFTLDIPPVIPS